MTSSALEERITRLEDIKAIKQLKVRYSHICDDLHNPDEIASVFAEDGVWESLDFGMVTGHAAIRELFKKFQATFSFSQHNMTNPLITSTGTGLPVSCTSWGPGTTPTPARNSGSRCATTTRLRYDDEYVKVDGEWKYKHLRLQTRLAEDRNAV